MRKIIGKVGVPKAMTAPHPAIALIAQDDVRRQEQASSSLPMLLRAGDCRQRDFVNFGEQNAAMVGRGARSSRPHRSREKCPFYGYF
jgi:hypothetical protein